MQKSKANLMNRWDAMQQAPRCHATSKRTGKPCQAPSVRGQRVCRSHGARGGAPMGPTNGAWRHGLHSNEAVAERQRLNDLVRKVKRRLRQLHDRA
jgi:hypothetical protein